MASYVPTLSFKVSAQEMAEIRSQARQQKQNFSEFLRARALHRSPRTCGAVPKPAF